MTRHWLLTLLSGIVGAALGLGLAYLITLDNGLARVDPRVIPGEPTIVPQDRASQWDDCRPYASADYKCKWRAL